MDLNHGSSDICRLQNFDLFASWKGKDFRNFLLHYGLPLLLVFCDRPEIISNFKNLQDSIYILSGKNLDDIDLSLAKSKIDQFLQGVKDIFGFDKISPNFHELSHLADIARNSGPLWLHSTFDYEGFNLVIRNFVRSSLRPELQIIDRLNMAKTISSEYNEIENWDQDMINELTNINPSIVKEDSIKVLGTPKIINSTYYYNRAIIGWKKISTAEYSNSFKKKDCFIYQNGTAYRIIDISGNTSPILTVKKLKMERVSMNMFEITGEYPGLDSIPLDMMIQKLVPARFNERLFLSFLPITINK